jgi:hypothetical protein
MLSDPDYLPYEEMHSAVSRCIEALVSHPTMPCRLLALDFDATLVQVHTYGRWPGSAEALSAHLRPVFKSLLQIASSTPNLYLGIVTFSGQSNLIRSTLASVLGAAAAELVFIRGNNRDWAAPPSCVSMEGKQPHIASIVQEIFFDTGEQLDPQQVCDYVCGHVYSVCKNECIHFCT